MKFISRRTAPRRGAPQRHAAPRRALLRNATISVSNNGIIPMKYDDEGLPIPIARKRIIADWAEEIDEQTIPEIERILRETMKVEPERPSLSWMLLLSSAVVALGILGWILARLIFT